MRCWFVRACVGALLLLPAGVGAETLTFGWKLPSRAVVTHEALKKGQTARMTYVLAAEPEGPGGGFLVHMRDLDFLSVMGKPIDTPELKQAVAPALALVAAVPSMRIAADGTLAGFAGDFGAMIDGLEKLAGANAPDKARAVFRSMRNSPQMRGAIEAKAADSWNFAVGVWLGLAIAEGETVESSTDIDMFGHTVTQPMTLRHLGRTDDCPRCIRLALNAMLNGPKFREAYLASFESIAGQTATAEQIAGFKNALQDISRETVAELVTDPATLRPEFLSVETRIRLVMAGRDPVEQLERKVYQFDWSETTR